MKRTNPHAEREKKIRLAQSCLTRAAAALVEWPLEKDALAYALLMASTALDQMAKADTDLSALAKVERVLGATVARRATQSQHGAA